MANDAWLVGGIVLAVIAAQSFLAPNFGLVSGMLLPGILAIAFVAIHVSKSRKEAT